MNKKITLITIIIVTSILILNITSTTANDNTTIEQTRDNVTASNENTDITPYKKDIKQESTSNVNSYEELKNVIEKANQDATSQTINLNEGNYTISETLKIGNGLTPMSIIINGNNNTIFGLDNNSFISVKRRANLSLNNITISNINSQGGCCINNIGNSILNNVTIKNINSTYNTSIHGGSIFSRGSLTINSCRFENISYESPTYGGACIYSSGNLTINSSIFKNNTAPRASCIYIINSTNTTIINSSFNENHASDIATIIGVRSQFNIIDSKFSNNEAKRCSQIYTEDSSECNIINTTITGSKSDDYAICNFNSMNIINSTISGNKVNDSIILNLNKLNITNSEFNDNIADRIVFNENYRNYFQNTSQENNQNYNISNIQELSIYNGTFKNNSADIIIDGLNSTIEIVSSKFINNDINELFDGTNETFKKVSENVYLGNNLKSSIGTAPNYTFNANESVLIEGLVNTKEIYNTTINSGVVYAYADDRLVGSGDVENSKYSLNASDYLEDFDNYLSIVFSDYPNYQNSTCTTVVTIIPEEKYEVTISNITDSMEYNDTLEYVLSIENTGKVDIKNFSLHNVIPSNLTYVNSTNQDMKIDPISNTMHIDLLEVEDKISTSIRLRTDSIDDFVIHFNISDDKNRTCLDKEIPIRILKSLIKTHIDYDTNNLEIMKNHSIPLIIKNVGNCSAKNTKIYFVYDNKTNPINMGPVDVNESISILLNISSENLGTKDYKIIITDELYNTTEEVNGSFNFTRERIENIYITLDKISTYANKTINITAVVHNIYSYSIADCVFKISQLSIKDHEITIENNSICLLNYVVGANWSRSNYIVEVKIRLGGTSHIISNKTTLTLNKTRIYSIIYNESFAPGKQVSLKARFIDEFGNNVQKGVMLFKINGKSIKIFVKINDGIATLNYTIPTTYTRLTYNLTVVYGENSRYLSNRNSTSYNLTKQETEIDITNTTFTKLEDFTMSAKIYGKSNKLPAYTGRGVFKINGKVISPILKVVNGSLFYRIEKIPFNFINNITVCYSGNTLLSGVKKSITFSQ